jgi:hypothetical protein
MTLMIDGDEYVVIREDDAEEIHRKTLIFDGVDDSKVSTWIDPSTRQTLRLGPKQILQIKKPPQPDGGAL